MDGSFRPVSWNGPDDPENPQNWRLSRKWTATALYALFIFLPVFSAGASSSAVTQIGAALGVSDPLTTSLISSIFTLGYAVGPFFWVPLTEVYGRSRIMHLSGVLYLIFNLVCGFLKRGDMAAMLALRFLTGFAGSATATIAGGMLSDCWTADHRGAALSTHAFVSLAGTVLGIVVGDLLVQQTDITGVESWRVTFFGTAMLDVACFGILLLFLHESHAPTVLRRRTGQLRKTAVITNLHTTTGTEIESYTTTDGEYVWKYLTRALIQGTYRPLKLLLYEPILVVCAVSSAYQYSNLYILLAGFPRVWKKAYMQPVGTAVLHNFSLILGFGIGALIEALTSDRIYRKLKKRNEGVGKAEFRIPSMFVGSVLVPLGLLIYGWAVQYRVIWIVPDIGASMFATGAMICYHCLQSYIIDSTEHHAASGMAPAIVLRSLIGTGLPLFADAAYDAFDYGVLVSILAAFATGFRIPITVVLWRHGEWLRA